MKILSDSNNKQLIRQYIIAGAILGTTISILEYLVRLGTDEPQAFLPLIIRANINAILITASIAFFEISMKAKIRKKTFLQIVAIRSFSYTIIISIWLCVINGFWGMINRSLSFGASVLDYITDESYLINLLSVLFFITIFIGFQQINSLHRKGELLEFILGKYHKPKETERIFCFIDLKGSTTIGEKLGHFQFGLFLRDYYSDITDAIRGTEAEIYQYIGDEVVLYWSYKKGLKNNNCINCFFLMKESIENLKEKYLEKYGVYPIFKAGLHGGKATIIRVGEIKKEIVYIGDVLNTTSRIQESCKRLSREFLVSEGLLNKIKNLGNIKASFMEETALRGKEKTIKLYSLELMD